MNQSDKIREFVRRRYIEPARLRGDSTVTVRAGDVHSEMRLHQRMPQVCSALRAKKLVEQSGVSLTDWRGPAQRANVWITFRLDDQARPISNGRAETTSDSGFSTGDMTSRDATPADPAHLFLVSCVAKKLSVGAPAKEIYVSDWFRKARQYVESRQGRWYILSAKYGLLDPSRLIEPYEQSLNTMSSRERSAWADDVWATLSPLLEGVSRVTVFAGARYREYLMGHLTGRVADVEVPLEGLRIGEQLSWFGERQ